MRPGTGQQHGPKAFVCIRCPVSQPLFFQASAAARVHFFFAALVLPSESIRDPADRGEMGSVKGETKGANFGKGKCKLIAKCEFFSRESVNSSQNLVPQW